MGQPGARVTDTHACTFHPPNPLATASSDVYTGGIPAARVSDQSACSGMVLKGSASVLVNKKPAARMGDPTVHGGAIAKGEPTVLIGDQSSGGGASPDAILLEILNRAPAGADAAEFALNLADGSARGAAFVTPPANFQFEAEFSAPAKPPAGALHGLVEAADQLGRVPLLGQVIRDVGAVSNDVTRDPDAPRRIVIDLAMTYLGGKLVQYGGAFLKPLMAKIGTGLSQALSAEAARLAPQISKLIGEVTETVARLRGGVQAARLESVAPADEWVRLDIGKDKLRLPGGAITEAEFEDAWRRLTLAGKLEQYVPYRGFDEATAKVIARAGINQARSEIGLSGRTVEGAHFFMQAFAKHVPGFDPNTALVKPLEAEVHTTMDDTAKAIFQALRHAGYTEQSAGQVFRILSAAIKREVGLSEPEKASMIQHLFNEMFTSLRLNWNQRLPIPNTRVKGPRWTPWAW